MFDATVTLALGLIQVVFSAEKLTFVQLCDNHEPRRSCNTFRHGKRLASRSNVIKLESFGRPATDALAPQISQTLSETAVIPCF